MRNTIPIMDLNNPDELIRANGAAEAARTNRLREEVSDYTQVIEQLRDLYDRNNELVQKLQFMNRSQTDEIRRLLQENNDQITEKLSSLQDYDTKALQDSVTTAVSDSQETVLAAVQKSQDHASYLQQQSDDFNHKENFRVYRNIQASMIAELGKQTQELSARLDALQESTRTDPADAFMRKITFGVVIAILAIQLLEGVGLLTLLLSLH
jgi:DNA repair exonuclease SbcCD ATPase subunit